jgi:hypothetical protein
MEGDLKMVKIRILWVIPLLLAFHSAKGQQTCHGPDVNSATFIKGLNAMMDTSQIAFRASLQMPLVTSSAIALVTDAAVCAQAGFAADSIFKVWAPSATLNPTTAPIYVIKIGTSYAVVDLNSADTSDGDWVFIFGPLWEYRGSIAL